MLDGGAPIVELRH
jgi:hypothetical protein